MIEFPSPWPIKVVGVESPAFRAAVLETVTAHAKVLDDPPVSVRLSAQASYASVSMTIEATGEEQLGQLTASLMAMTAVKLVL